MSGVRRLRRSMLDDELGNERYVGRDTASGVLLPRGVDLRAGATGWGGVVG